MTNASKIKEMIIILFLLLFSCKENNKNENLISIEFKDSLFLKENVIEVIRNYIKENPSYNSYYISMYIDLQCSHGIKGFFLGPAYEDLFESYKPIMFLNIGGKRIYVRTGSELLFKKAKYAESLFAKKDSIINEYGFQVKDADELFVRKSIFFSTYFDNSISVDLRPDTSMVPKRIATLEFNP
jgi:hypothetical protein